MDCRLDDGWSSNSSFSAISIDRRLWELMEDAVDLDAACKEQPGVFLFVAHKSTAKRDALQIGRRSATKFELCPSP